MIEIKDVYEKVWNGREYCHITLTRIVVNTGSTSFDLYTKMAPAEILRQIGDKR